MNTSMPFPEAGPDSPEHILGTKLTELLRTNPQPASVVLNVLFSYYRHAALAHPEHWSESILGASSLAGELLSLQGELMRRQPALPPGLGSNHTH